MLSLLSIYLSPLISSFPVLVVVLLQTRFIATAALETSCFKIPSFIFFLSLTHSLLLNLVVLYRQLLKSIHCHSRRNLPLQTVSVGPHLTFYAQTTFKGITYNYKNHLNRSALQHPTETENLGISDDLRLVTIDRV